MKRSEDVHVFIRKSVYFNLANDFNNAEAEIKLACGMKEFKIVNMLFNKGICDEDKEVSHEALVATYKILDKIRLNADKELLDQLEKGFLNQKEVLLGKVLPTRETLTGMPATTVVAIKLLTIMA